MAGPPAPKRISPADRAVLTTLPLFRASAPGATNVYVRIKTRARRWLTVLPMVREGTTDTFRYQLRAPGTSKVMNLKFSGAAVRGSYRLRLFSAVTPWIPYNEADLDTIIAEIETLPDLNPGDVIVSGRPYQPSGLSLTLTNNRNGMFQARDFYTGWSADAYGLKDSAGNTLGLSMTTPTEGTGDLPSSTGNPNGHQDWYWDVIAADASGFFQASSGGTTRNPRDAVSIGEGMFWYSSVPVLNVTRPTEGQTYTSDNPYFEWNVTGDSTGMPISYQEITFIRKLDGRVVHTAATPTPPPTNGDPAAVLASVLRDILEDPLDEDAEFYRIPKRKLTNDTDYWADFRAKNQAGQQAYVRRGFKILYGKPAATTTFTVAVSSTMASLAVSWAASTATTFEAYLIKWRPAEVGWDSDQVRTVYRTENKARTSATIYEFPLGKSFVLGHFVEITDANGEIQTSAAKEWTPPGGSLMARITVLSQVSQGTRRVVILPARRIRTVTANFKREVRQPWNQRFPVVSGDAAFNHTYQATFPISEAGDVQAQMKIIAALEQMADDMYPVFVKDFYGRTMYTQVIPPISVSDPETVSYQEVSLVLEETAEELEVTYG